MELSRIDPVALLVAAAASGFALMSAPGGFGYRSTAEGITLLLVLFGYDRQGYRSALQSLAFSAAAAACLVLAGAYALGLLVRPLKIPPDDNLYSALDGLLALSWAGTTVLFWGIDRARMASREETTLSLPASASRSARQGFIAQSIQPQAPAAPVAPFFSRTPPVTPPQPPASLDPLFQEPVERVETAPIAPIPPPIAAALPAAAPIPRSAKTVTIFVNLLGESMSVLRAVQAEHAGGDFYLIVDEMPANENWEFKPGQLVRCKKKNLSNGKGLVAFEEAPRAN